VQRAEERGAELVVSRRGMKRAERRNEARDGRSGGIVVVLDAHGLVGEGI